MINRTQLSGSCVISFAMTALAVCCGVPRLQASSVRVSAISGACICSGNGSDVGDTENSGSIYGIGSVAYESSGPYSLTGPGGSAFYADGWSSADTMGTLRAFGDAIASVPYKQSTGSGSSFWDDTVQTICDPNNHLPGNCNITGFVTFQVEMRLDDNLSSANYGQYGGGGLVHYYGSGVMAGMDIEDSTRNGVDIIDPTHFLTMNVTEANNAFYDIGANLDALSSAQEGFSETDASSTALFSIVALTPGGSYAEQDGIVFATSVDPSVPEPGTVALMALGLTGLAFLKPLRRL